jgi:ureidoglycolate lyase
MRLKTTDITTIDFSAYGKVLDMRNGGTGLYRSTGDGYVDVCTALSIIDTPASLGFTCSCPVPFTTKQMERHGHTQEAQFCAEEPIVFLVAPPTLPGVAPKAQDVIAVLLPLGYAVVLNRGVWHSASHCIYSEKPYYWLATVYKDEPTEWMCIDGGPIEVVL